MPRSTVILLSWIVAGAFVLGTGVQYVDRLNLVATPPDLSGANMVDQALGSLAYRQAIWPVYLWTNLLFATGFLAAVAFAAVAAARSGVAGGLPLFVALATTGGIIAAIASIIPIGAVNAAVWLGYCDCGFKDTEIVSQDWAGMVAQDIGDWMNRIASVVLALALVALLREGRSVVTPALRRWTWLTAGVLALLPILATVGHLFDPLMEPLTAIASAVLIPVWAVLLGRSVDAAPATGPAAAA